jgi:hypothetical protein
MIALAKSTSSGSRQLSATGGSCFSCSVGTTSRPPKWIKPQLMRLVEEASTGKDWLPEIRNDGCPRVSVKVGPRSAIGELRRQAWRRDLLLTQPTTLLLPIMTGRGIRFVPAVASSHAIARPTPDAALSRLKHGFESRRERQIFQTLRRTIHLRPPVLGHSGDTFGRVRTWIKNRHGASRRLRPAASSKGMPCRRPAPSRPAQSV